MFSSFIQYEWSSDAKGAVDQLQGGALHVTVVCDSVTVVNIGRGTTISSSTSLFSLILFF